MYNDDSLYIHADKILDWICLDKISWSSLSMNQNSNAIHLLEKNLEEVSWRWLSLNPNAIHLLEKNQDKINWTWLSSNPNAMHLLEKNLDKVDWEDLSYNPNAIHLLEKNLNKVRWDNLSSNPNATHLLEQNQNKIDWVAFSRNPSIFKKIINYKFLKENMDVIREELLMKCMHPARLERWLEMGGDIDDF